MSDKQARLDAIAAEIHGHVPCGFAICEEATNLVPGDGNPDAAVVVVKARPPKNRDPKPDEVAHHLPWLHAQLDVIAPRFVVTLGRHALGRFVEGVTIGEAHGKPVTREDGLTLFPMYHPAAALHNQSLRSTLTEDAQRLGEVLRG
jgi:uracil-DNA glycosylase